MKDPNFLKTLPPYLQKDINNLLKEINNKDSKIIDCLLCEVMVQLILLYIAMK